jgi:hypothetical protein
MKTIRNILEVVALLVLGVFMVGVLFGLSWAFLRDVFPNFYDPIVAILQNYADMVPQIAALVLALTLLLLISRRKKGA